MEDAHLTQGSKGLPLGEPVEVGLLLYQSLRRWKLIVAIFILLCLPLGLYVYRLPHLYRSVATVMVKADDLALDETVMGELEGGIDLSRRMNVLAMQINSRSRLMPIMEKFGLYDEMRATGDLDGAIFEMRDSIYLEPRKSSAFRVGFRDSDPKMAQAVTQEIVDSYINEIVRAFTQEPAARLRTLERRVAEATAEMTELSSQLEDLRSGSVARLVAPDGHTMETLVALKVQKRFMDGEIQALQEKSLEGEVYTEVEEPALPGERRLTAMDLAKEEEDIAKIYHQAKETGGAQAKALMEQFNAAWRKMRMARGRKRLESVRSISLIRKRRLISEQSHRLREEQNKLALLLTTYERLFMGSSADEARYQALEYRYQTRVQEYQELVRIKGEAELAHSQGDVLAKSKFQIIEPPNLPEAPYWPNKTLMIIVGSVGSLLAGLALVMFLEHSRTSFHGAESLARFTGFPVLAEIPQIDTRQ